MAPITQSASQPELRSPRNCCKKTLYGSDWSRLATGRKYSQQPGYILFSHNPTALWIILFHAGSLNGRLRNRFFLPRNDHGNNSAGGRKCFWAWQRPFVSKTSDMFVCLCLFWICLLQEVKITFMNPVSQIFWVIGVSISWEMVKCNNSFKKNGVQ